jgi:hypothetical protein
VPLLAILLALGSSIDAASILARAQEVDDRNVVIEKNYTFEQRVETHELNSKGGVQSTTIKTYDTILTGGRPYQRLVGKDDKPLPAADEAKEQAKAKKEADDRARETPAQREKAVAAEEQRRQKNREMAHEVMKAFDFRILSEDDAEWILEATPRPGYKPINRDTSVLPHFRGKIWISKASNAWTKFDAEAIDTVSFGLVLARLDKGAHIVIERTQVNGEVWLPHTIHVQAAARIALVKKFRVDMRTTCRNFRKFSSESRILN